MERFARADAGGGGQVVSVDGVVGRPDSERVVQVGGAVFAVEAGRAVPVERVDQLGRRLADEAGPGRATAPMHGRIVAVHVRVGDVVARDAPLFAVEAMKMEHTVKAPTEARVVEVRMNEGDQAEEGAEVVVLASPDLVDATAQTRDGPVDATGTRPADAFDAASPGGSGHDAAGAPGAPLNADEETHGTTAETGEDTAEEAARKAVDETAALAEGVAAAAAQLLAAATLPGGAPSNSRADDVGGHGAGKDAGHGGGHGARDKSSPDGGHDGGKDGGRDGGHDGGQAGGAEGVPTDPTGRGGG